MLIMYSIITPLQADFDEKYRLTIGGSVNYFDSKLSINSRDGSVDKEIDFEDRLGMDTTLRLGWVRGSRLLPSNWSRAECSRADTRTSALRGFVPGAE